MPAPSRLWAILLALGGAGCASHPLVLTQRIAPALDGAALDFQVQHFNARLHKGFLSIDVRAKRTDAEYHPNLDLELAGAASVCAALARSAAVFDCEWQEFDLKFWNEYGNMFRWRNTVGFVKVCLSRQTFLEVREQKVPASEYPRYWRIECGSKAGPDLPVPLEWGPTSAPSE